MQLYRFIIRHEHEFEDSALALSHVEVLKDGLKNSVGEKQSIYRRDTLPSGQRDGECMILVATEEESLQERFKDYAKG